MFFEKMFGNVFGFIWLIVFSVGVLGLLVWLFMKKDQSVEERFDIKVEDVKDVKEERLEVNEEIKEEKKELVKVAYKNYIIEENSNGKFDVLIKNSDFIVKTFNNLDDAMLFVDVLLLRESDSNYEIFEEDDFFKVRKKGGERTLRKFVTKEEAENYIKEKENND